MNTYSVIEKWKTIAEELYLANKEIKELTSRKASLINKLKMLSGNKTAFNAPYLFELSFRSGAINYGVIPELMDVNLESYRKEKIPAWSLKRID